MTLDQQVRQYSDETLYIGAETGWFFIGTKDEYLDQIDGITLDFIRKYRNGIGTRKNKLAQLCGPKKKKDNESAEDYGKRLIKCGQLIPIEFAAIREAEKRLNDFTDFRGRKVVETYNRTTGGIAIKIEGNDRGDYWDKEEWDKAHGGNHDNKD